MPRTCKLLAGEPSINLIGCPSAGNKVKKSCFSELAGHNPKPQTDADCLHRFLGSCIDNAEQANLMACDLTEVFKRVALWTKELPRVKPFYAVKCNTDLPLLKILAASGVNFDCASLAEIDTVLTHTEADASRIIFANPCKFKRDILHAKRVGVLRTTFDSEMELQKFARLWPDVECVLRIAPKQFKAQCQLDNKFGASVHDVPGLLALAKELQLNVIGISFHVGSGCAEPTAWAETVRLVGRISTLFPSYGFQFKFLDIGGGFPGQSQGMATPGQPLFKAITKPLRDALDDEFAAGGDVEIIAEPGRFFASAAYTALTEIYACKKMYSEDGTLVQQLYSGDGVYGSFNNTIFDHQQVRLSAVISPWNPNESSEKRIEALSFDNIDNTTKQAFEPLLGKYIQTLDNLDSTEGQQQELLKTAIFGPTCDGIDCLNLEHPVPEIRYGDWLVWRDMGAYTISAASSFNGMPLPKLFYFLHNATPAEETLTRRALNLEELN